MAHGDAVVDTDGVELEGHAAGLTHRLFHQPADILQVNVPGNDVDVAVTTAMKGLPISAVSDARGLEQGAVGRSGVADFDSI